MPSFISWVPTPEEDIDVFFQLATVSQSDVIYDLGCGDGRLLFTALEKGAGKAVGIDIDPERISECKEIAKNKGLEDRIRFIESDVMDVNLSDATLIFCYLITAASAALKPKFASELKNGTRIVMESFPVPGWKPLETKNFGYKTFYLYQMPPVISE
jgi:ribosomal protein L11 methylase PrmA